jgi:haloacetate dehalogenase
MNLIAGRRISYCWLLQLDIEQKITCPVLVLWGAQGIMGRKYDVLAHWQTRAIEVTGQAIDCGHFLPEEAPEETLSSLREFFR